MELPIPDDWDGESFCRWAVCWPDSIKWKAVLHGLLETPNQGRLWDFSTGNFLLLRSLFLPAYNYNFKLKGVIMACNDAGLTEIAAALNKIALNNNGCCDDRTLSPSLAPVFTIELGGDLGGTIPILGTQPPVVVGPDEVPDGYPDRAAFDADKCAKAAEYVDSYLLTLRVLTLNADINLSIGLLIAIIGGVPGLLVIGIEALPVLLAWLLVIAAYKGILLEWISETETHRTELVCAYYNANGTASGSHDFLEALLALLAELDLPVAVIFGVRAILIALLGSDAINKLYTWLGFGSTSDFDCSVCQESDCANTDFDMIYGVLDVRNDEECLFTFESSGVGGGLYRLDFTITDGDNPKEAVMVSLDTNNSSEPPGGGDQYRVWDIDIMQIYGSDAIPSFPLEHCTQISVTHSAPFSVTFGFNNAV